ncbi:MAG: creatininase family protein [Actinomycetota bacterium]
MPHRRFAELRSPQISTLITPGSTLLQPVGSIEQHGDHLPLETDLLVATATAEAVVNRVGDELDLWLLPPLAYTKSNEHAWSPGTIWLSPSTLLAVLDDVGRSLSKLPCRRLAFINGHGGNTALLNVACRELRLSHGLMTFLLHPQVPPDHGGSSPAIEFGMGIHGGLDETSVVLHLRPDLVDMSVARRHVPERLVANRQVRFGGAVVFGWTSDDFGPSGIVGDPSEATSARGKELFESAVSNLAEALGEVKAFEFPLA